MANASARENISQDHNKSSASYLKLQNRLDHKYHKLIEKNSDLDQLIKSKIFLFHNN